MEAQNTTEILHDFSPRFRVYNNGRVERLGECGVVPPSFDHATNVHSKDVTISPGVSARLYLPANLPEKTKLPLLIYFHGGAFCRFSASSSIYHNYLNSLVSQARLIAVSADYRLAPEHSIPACYDDSWAVAQWAATHSTGSGPDPWLNDRADYQRVYVAGDSAGANIAHDVIVRAGPGGLIGPGARLVGCILVHPYFGNGRKDKLWEFLCGWEVGPLGPRQNPAADPARMRREMGCARVAVCVDKGDWLKDRGVRYYEALKECGWRGEAELMETNGGDHVFHLCEAEVQSDESMELMKFICSFINKE